MLKSRRAVVLSQGFGDLQSALKGVAGSNARRTSARSRAVLLSQGFRDLQSALKGVARSNARSTSALRVDAGNIAQAGVLSDEEPFVQFLAGRAALLDDEFQAKIASLPFGEVRSPRPSVSVSGRDGTMCDHLLTLVGPPQLFVGRDASCWLNMRSPGRCVRAWRKEQRRGRASSRVLSSPSSVCLRR